MESEGGGWGLHGVVKLHGASKGDGISSLYSLLLFYYIIGDIEHKIPLLWNFCIQQYVGLGQVVADAKIHYGIYVCIQGRQPIPYTTQRRLSHYIH